MRSESSSTEMLLSSSIQSWVLLPCSSLFARLRRCLGVVCMQFSGSALVRPRAGRLQLRLAASASALGRGLAPRARLGLGLRLGRRSLRPAGLGSCGRRPRRSPSARRTAAARPRGRAISAFERPDQPAIGDGDDARRAGRRARRARGAGRSSGSARRQTSRPACRP